MYEHNDQRNQLQCMSEVFKSLEDQAVHVSCIQKNIQVTVGLHIVCGEIHWTASRRRREEKLSYDQILCLCIFEVIVHQRNMKIRLQRSINCIYSLCLLNLTLQPEIITSEFQTYKLYTIGKSNFICPRSQSLWLICVCFLY